MTHSGDNLANVPSNVLETARELRDAWKRANDKFQTYETRNDRNPNHKNAYGSSMWLRMAMVRRDKYESYLEKHGVDRCAFENQG